MCELNRPSPLPNEIWCWVSSFTSSLFRCDNVCGAVNTNCAIVEFFLCVCSRIQLEKCNFQQCYLMYAEYMAEKGWRGAVTFSHHSS